MTMVQVPEGTKVSTQGQNYVQEKEGHAAYQRRSFKLSSGCLRLVNWTIFSCLTSQASKLHYLLAFYGVVKDTFFNYRESMKSATAFLPMSSASIRSLAMPGLAGTPNDKKYSSLSSKLELKRLVKPETASSTRSTLHLSKLNVSFQCIEELLQYIEL